MNLRSQGEINGFIMGPDGMILKFSVHKKMHSGTLGLK
jgi:hypothetical protein